MYFRGCFPWRVYFNYNVSIKEQKVGTVPKLRGCASEKSLSISGWDKRFNSCSPHPDGIQRSVIFFSTGTFTPVLKHHGREANQPPHFVSRLWMNGATPQFFHTLSRHVQGQFYFDILLGVYHVFRILIQSCMDFKLPKLVHLNCWHFYIHWHIAV